MTSTNPRFELRAVRTVMMIALGGLLAAACDPPKSQSTPSSSGGATAATERASTTAIQTAKVNLPSSGDVVLMGGWSSGGKSTATAEFYDPIKGKFLLTGSMAATAGALSAALLDSGKLLVAGGFGGKSKFTHKTISTSVTGSATTNLQTYDPLTGLFTATTSPLATARFGATATVLPSGKVLIAGGIDTTGTPLNTAEVFDPAAGTTSATVNTMGSARAFHTATLVGSKVLLVGGASDATGTPTATADLYDPVTNTFTPTIGMLGEPLGAHAAVVLNTGPDSGKVLIVGGITNISANLLPTNNIELYDPVAETFSTPTQMKDFRAFPSATVLDTNGDVLIVGGFANFFSTVSSSAGSGSLMSLFGSTLKSAEIYDPITQTSACVPGKGFGGGLGLNACLASMKMARAAHTATLFTSVPLQHEVLIAGGIGASRPNSTSTELNEAELYNPATNAFKKTGSLKKARGLQAAILLP